LFYGKLPVERLRQEVDLEALGLATAQLRGLEFAKGEG
jgi:hypothetical protein